MCKISYFDPFLQKLGHSRNINYCTLLYCFSTLSSTLYKLPKISQKFPFWERPGTWGKSGKFWETSYLIISQLFYMPDENRHKINCWIPESLWEKVEFLGYDSPTKATIAGYEALIEKAQIQEERERLENKREILGNIQEHLGNDPGILGKQLEEAQKQITILEDRLSKAPDPVELIEIRAHFEGLQKLIEEKERLIEEKEERIKDLTREVTTLNGFAHYFKTAEVKQIEAPAAEKKKPWYKFW